MKRLKVAVFNTQPPQLYFGGVERRIIEMAKRLRNDVDTRVYSGSKKGFNKVSSIDGTTFIPCFSTDVFFPVDNWFFNMTVSKMSNAIREDVFEAHNVSAYRLLKAIKERGIKSPFIQTIHGVLADEYLQSAKSELLTLRSKLSNLIMWRLSKVEEESARNATLIVTVSKYSSNKIATLYGVEQGKIRIVPNGVDAEKFKPQNDFEKLKHRIGIKDKQCVLFVGRLVPRKGLHFLLEAAKNILREDKKVVFLIVGDGPLKGNLIKCSRKMGLSKDFIFFGDASEYALPELYNCADVFVLPSVQEGLGITLLEAQATAKPVVAFNVGGVGEVVRNKETGLLVRPDVYDLANAILDLLSNSSLREKMGRKGREFVSTNFSWDVCARNLLNVYLESSRRSGS